MPVRLLLGAVVLLSALSPVAGAQTVAPAPAPAPSASPTQTTVPPEIQPGGPKRPPDVQGPAADPLARDPAAPSAAPVAPTLPAPAAPGDARGVVPR